MTAPEMLSVAVLVELERTSRAGGHVKCWERLARAATLQPWLDLSVYSLGARARTEHLDEHVRFVELPPVLSTRRLGALVGGVDPSDLAPFHPGLARRLPQHDLWHLTHSFSFAGTALRMRRRCRRPLVASVHTDVPALTSLYTQQVLGALPAPTRSVLRRSRLDRVAPAVARRLRDRVLRSCDHVLVSSGQDEHEIGAAAPGVPLTRLRRGTDRDLFRPSTSARARVRRRYGLPAGRPLVFFAGRVDVTKGAPLLAAAVDRLNASGRDVHLVIAGEGSAAADIRSVLGGAVSLLGALPQRELADVYAACDVFAFPSRSETVGNVVGEAMAAGLPVVLPAGARTVQWLAVPGEDGLLVDEDHADAWAAALWTLLEDRLLRAGMGQKARKSAERGHPTWEEVLEDDLLPVWRLLADRHRREAPSGSGGA